MADFIYDGIVTSAANTQVGVYPYINVKQTESGHQDISDDTPGNEFRRWQHGTAGTYEHWHTDGGRDIVVQGNNFTVIVGDDSVVIQGGCKVEIYGNSSLHVYGNMYSQIDGTLSAIVTGDSSVYCAGETDITAQNDINITSATGDINLNTQDSVNIQGDVIIQGAVTCKSLTSQGNINSKSKVFATVGIDTLGGINVGFSTPTGTFGTIVASTSVTAPQINGTVQTYGGVLMDPQGGAPQMRGAFDSHFHNVLSKDFGVTGGPTPSM
jgi:hypothetical protein